MRNIKKVYVQIKLKEFLSNEIQIRESPTMV